MPSGCFIVLEGPEGAGKTTLAAALVARMRRDGLEVVSIREPGGTPVAEAYAGASWAVHPPRHSAAHTPRPADRPFNQEERLHET